MNATGDTLPGLKLAGPRIEAADVASLLRVLRGAESWLTAKEIAEQMYGRTDATLERRVRATASAARPAVVSFPGSPGYNLWERCSRPEIDHGISSLESQGRDMMKQANVYRAACLRRFREAKPEDNTAPLFV